MEEVELLGTYCLLLFLILYRLIERTLGINADQGHRFNQGTLNSGLGEGIRTSYGRNQSQAHLYNFNDSFNNNRYPLNVLIRY